MNNTEILHEISLGDTIKTDCGISGKVITIDEFQSRIEIQTDLGNTFYVKPFIGWKLQPKH